MLLKDIGSNAFIAKVKAFSLQCDMDDLAEDFQIPKERVSMIFKQMYICLSLTLLFTNLLCLFPLFNLKYSA